MYRNRTYILLIVTVLTGFSSCRQMFTTSLAEGLARDKLTIPNSTPTTDLVTMAREEGAQSPDTAKALLEALSSKSTDEITGLSIDDKTDILNLSVSATITIETVTNLTTSVSDETADPEVLIQEFFDNFDSTADLDVIETLLADPETLTDAPIDTIVLSTVVLAADLAEDIGADTIMVLLANPLTPLETPLTAEQQTRLDLIISVQTAMEKRTADGTETAEIAGFDLTDLLQGNIE